jgi:hypothetical protein
VSDRCSLAGRGLMLDCELATTELTQGLESLRNRVATDPFCAPFARASWPGDAGLQCKYFAFVYDIGFNHRGLAVVAPAIGPAYNTECDQIG